MPLLKDLERPNRRIEAVYFLDNGIASVVAVQPDETRIEVGLIGRGLSLMLGVRRAGVTEALQSLKRQKLIDNGRNKIVVLNRKGIERVAGKSYGTPEKEYRRLIG